jgi:hypothetical protein
MINPDDLVAALLAPVSPHHFATEYWAKKHLLVKGALQLSDSWNPLLDVLQFLSDERLIMVMEAQARNARGSRRILPANADINEILDAGEHLQLRNLQKILPENHRIVQLATTLETFLGHPLDSITMIVSPSNSQMIPEHFDLTEIFTIQVRGSKVWSIVHPDERLPREVTIEAGDLLYIPARTPHKVLSTDTSAISYALVYRPIRLDAVLAELAREVLMYDALNAETLPIMGPSHPDRLSLTTYERHLKRWSQLLSETSPSTLFWKARQLSLTLEQEWPRQFLPDWIHVDASTSYERTARPLPSCDFRENTVHLTIGGGVSLSIPGFAILELTRILMSSEPFTASDIYQLITPSEVVLLLRKIHQLGLVKPARIPRSGTISGTVRASGPSFSPCYIANLSAYYALIDSSYAAILDSAPRSALQIICTDESTADAALRCLQLMPVSRVSSHQIIERQPFTEGDLRVIVPEGYER